MDSETLEHALFGIPVSLTLSRAMFAGFDMVKTKYDTAAVKRHRLIIMRKLLGLPQR